MANSDSLGSYLVFFRFRNGLPENAIRVEANSANNALIAFYEYLNNIVLDENGEDQRIHPPPNPDLMTRQEFLYRCGISHFYQLGSASRHCDRIAGLMAGDHVFDVWEYEEVHQSPLSREDVASILEVDDYQRFLNDEDSFPGLRHPRIQVHVVPRKDVIVRPLFVVPLRPEEVK